MHIASIETACHALSISRGGKGLHGVLVIAKSSGIELHSLDAVVKEYLARINEKTIIEVVEAEQEQDNESVRVILHLARINYTTGT